MANYCIDCGKAIDLRAKRCIPCFQKAVKLGIVKWIEKLCVICGKPRPLKATKYCSECAEKVSREKHNASSRKRNKTHKKNEAEKEARKLYMRVRRHGTVFLLPRRGSQGDKNSNWKGDSAGYGAIHKWVRNHKPTPLLCEKCGLARKLELSNRDHEYRRNLDDYEWLCDKCHYDYDIENGLRSDAEYNFYSFKVDLHIHPRRIKITQI